MNEPLEISLRANGDAVTRSVEPRLTLADFLRHENYPLPAPISAASMASAASARCCWTGGRCGPA